jgi:hypothetical protein
MNRDDIERMAQAVGLAFVYNERDEDGWIELERFAILVAAAEREACEQACDRVRLRYQKGADKTGRFDLLNKADGAQDCLMEIRARGEK